MWVLLSDPVRVIRSSHERLKKLGLAQSGTLGPHTMMAHNYGFITSLSMSSPHPRRPTFDLAWQPSNMGVPPSSARISKTLDHCRRQLTSRRDTQRQWQLNPMKAAQHKGDDVTPSHMATQTNHNKTTTPTAYQHWNQRRMVEYGGEKQG
ncbi:hypothetical protein V6N12_016143 [Hibiscus sabdariffa]|uniref:Uncharacterized protein n=1 Tax=Hibiscus sabdariffa TaxID=183260 RepID=A0ABR2C8V1_9ROSI